MLVSKLASPLVSRQAGMIRGENSGRVERGALQFTSGLSPLVFILFEEHSLLG